VNTKPKNNRRSGLSLIELLVVIAIIATLGALLYPAIDRLRASARTAGCVSDLRQVHAAMMSHVADHGGRLPLPWNEADGRFIWEGALADPRHGGVYLPPESIEAGNPRRLLFNREIAAMGGDPRGNNPDMNRSYYQMNHEFNLSFGPRHGGNLARFPESMFRMASFETPSKTMLLISGWAPWYRMPHNRGRRGDLDWEGGPAFIHNGDHALVLYVGGNTGLLKKEDIPTDIETREWQEFWLPTLSGSYYE